MTEQEYVYAIGHPHGYVKVGRSINPEKRLDQHQTSSPYRLWLIVQIPTTNSTELESKLHGEFKNRWVTGEWYELTPDEYDILVDMMRMSRHGHEFDSIESFKQKRERQSQGVLG